jgi:hypothetical protein
MREVQRQKEKGKRAGDELRKRTLIQLVKIREIRVSNPCLSVCIHPPQFCYGGRGRGSNPVFKIKKPPQNARKIGKVMQDHASVLTPSPPPAPPCLAPTATRLSHKTLYFQSFCPRSHASIHVVFYPQKHAIYE